MAEPWLIRFFACNREMQPFSFLFCYSLWGGGGDFGSGSGSKFNCVARVGAGRVGSDDLGYGPGSGFSFEPVQTSKLWASMRLLEERAHYHSLYSLLILPSCPSTWAVSTFQIMLLPGRRAYWRKVRKDISRKWCTHVKHTKTNIAFKTCFVY